MTDSALADGGAVRLVLSTCPDAATARRLAETLVSERLAACGNVVPGLTSIYRWRGAVETATECLLLLKTRTDRLDALSARLLDLHPADLPELLVLPVDRGSAGYLAWVVEESADTA